MGTTVSNDNNIENVNLSAENISTATETIKDENKLIDIPTNDKNDEIKNSNDPNDTNTNANIDTNIDTNTININFLGELKTNIESLKTSNIWPTISSVLNVLYQHKDDKDVRIYSVRVIKTLISKSEESTNIFGNRQELKICVARMIFDFMITCRYMIINHLYFRKSIYNKLIEFSRWDRSALNVKIANDLAESDIPSVWAVEYFNFIFEKKFIPAGMFNDIFNNPDNNNNIQLSQDFLNYSNTNKPTSPFQQVVEELIHLNTKIDMKFNLISILEQKLLVEPAKITRNLENVRLNDIINDTKSIWTLNDIDMEMEIEQDSEMILPKNCKIIYPLINKPKSSSSNSNSNTKCLLPKNLDEFKMRFQHNPLTNDLSDFDLKDNIVIAGGSLSSLLLDKDYNSVKKEERPDIDLFFYGLNSPSVALEHAERLRQHLIVKWGSDNLRIFVSHYCITFVNTLNHRQIQLILCDYNSIGEILNDFDLGAACVAWNGSNLFFNSNGKFAYENGLNIVSLKNYRQSYEFRLKKYFHRGFGFIFPSLKIDTTTSSREINIGKLTMQFTKSNINSDGNIIGMYPYQSFIDNSNYTNDKDQKDQNKSKSQAKSKSKKKMKSNNAGLEKENDSKIENKYDRHLEDESNIMEWECKSEYASVPYSDINQIYWKNFYKLKSGTEKSVQNLIGFVDNKNFISFESTRTNVLSDMKILGRIFEIRLRTMDGLQKILKIFKNNEKACLEIMNCVIENKPVEWNKLIPPHINEILKSTNMVPCVLEFRNKITKSIIMSQVDEKKWFGEHYCI